MNTVPAHAQERTLHEVAWYPAHDGRSESAEFRHDKAVLRAEGHYDCWIGNGRCDGQIELHHNFVEWSSANGIDWDKVKADHPDIDHVDDIDQMLPLCRKHHRDEGYGVHCISEPIWRMQRYLTPEALDAFEAAVEAMIKRKNGGVADV
jgi:hypothetical protein